MVICQNEARRIGACLDSLSFCDELLVIDSGSTDGTLQIVREKGARLIERPFESMNDQKEFGRAASSGEWLLNVDADEVVSPALRDEIARLVARGGEGGVDAYRIPFRNYFRSAWVRRSGYYPDPHIRLVRRACVQWDRSVPVHDRVMVQGAVGRLSGHIDHYSFDSVADFVGKSSKYAERFAIGAHREGRRSGFATIVVHTIARFVKAYFFKGGFLEGTLGLTISGLQAYEVFLKYVRLWEIGRFHEAGRGSS